MPENGQTDAPPMTLVQRAKAILASTTTLTQAGSIGTGPSSTAPRSPDDAFHGVASCGIVISVEPPYPYPVPD